MPKPILKFMLLIMVLLASASTLFAQAENIEFDMRFVRGRVFIKSPDKEPFESHLGQYQVPSSTSIISLADGQCFIQEGDSELRTKQETVLTLLDEQKYELRQGLAGCRIGSATIRLTTAHLSLELSDAIVVIKTNPVLTRVCVVKGRAAATQGKSTIVVPAGHEIAAAPQRLSSVYKQSDELRFTWYWVSAEKEPALQ